MFRASTEGTKTISVPNLEEESDLLHRGSFCQAFKASSFLFIFFASFGCAFAQLSPGVKITRNPSKQPAANGGDTKGQPQLPLNFALGFMIAHSQDVAMSIFDSVSVKGSGSPGGGRMRSAPSRCRTRGAVNLSRSSVGGRLEQGDVVVDHGEEGS